MEKLQTDALRIAKRASVLMIKASQWLYGQLERIAHRLHAVLSKIPLSPLQWVVILYVLMGVIYAFATPAFEASDELKHVAYVQSLREGTLPVMGADTVIQEQAAQPPAYYALAALLVAPFEPFDLQTGLALNPYVQRDDPFSYGNKNLLLPSSAEEMGSSDQAVAILRLVNVAFGVVTIWAVWHIGTLLSPRRPSVAVLAASLTAFNPMFIFISASVTNLPLAMALNSVLVWLAMRMLSQGLTLPVAAAVGVLVAIAASVHLSALFVGVVVAGVALYVARRDGNWAPLATLIGVAVSAIAIVLGWWFARNITEYGDALGWGVWQALFTTRTAPMGIDTILWEWAHFRRSFWGLFGVGNLALGEFAYAMLDLLVFVSLMGVGFLMIQLYAIRDFAHARRELYLATVLFAVLLPGVIGYMVWSGYVPFVSGTSIFPLIGAAMAVLAVGFIEVVWWLLFLITPPDRSYVRAGDAVPNEALAPNSVWSARMLMLVAMITPFITIAPTYAPITPIAAIPPLANQIYARYGDVELIAYDTDFTRYVPGQLVPVTLYWRVIEPTDNDWTVTLALLPPNGGVLAKLNTYPGWGRLRTSIWEAGRIYADTYYLQLDPFFAGNFPLSLHVLWWDEAQQQHVMAMDQSGAPIPDVLLTMGALTFPHTAADNLASLLTVDVRLREFGRVLRAEQFNFDRESYQTSVVWEAIQPMELDYTMFVQILNENNEIVGQLDTQPVLPTRFWNYGERFLTDHIIVTDGPLRPGTYRVITGIYLLETLERLQTGHDPLNEGEPVDYLELFTFTIDETGQFTSEKLDQLLPLPPVEATPDPEATSDGTLDAIAAPLAPTEVGR